MLFNYIFSKLATTYDLSFNIANSFLIQTFGNISLCKIYKNDILENEFLHDADKIIIDNLYVVVRKYMKAVNEKVRNCPGWKWNYKNRKSFQKFRFGDGRVIKSLVNKTIPRIGLQFICL